MPEIMCMMKRMSADFSKGDEAISNDPLKYRFETFCFDPLNCKPYKAGPNRKVEGWNKMVSVEEDWVELKWGI